MLPSIEMLGVGKKYLIAHEAQARYGTIRDAITERARHAIGLVTGRSTGQSYRRSQEVFWALQDISLQINEGDRVGIIGRNGAGKSTLLKLLSRITSPTKGEIRIRGRVASLLEVGTGFHPELTGRENIFLNGAILGMTRAEIKRKFDEIVAFSEVENFLDTPVKRYSSGMYVRLAFAVAAHLEPEVLIVDEVLAVGDSQFQRKCLGKMQDVGAQGRTVLFVSHNMAAIQSLCDRGILLQNGRLAFDGKVEDCISEYHGVANSLASEVSWEDSASAPGNRYVRMRSVSVKPTVGPVISVDSGAEVLVEFENLTTGRSLDFTLYLYSFEGVCLFETGIVISDNRAAPKGVHQTRGVLPPHLLNSGSYRVTLVFGESQSHILFKLEDVVAFEVEHTSTGRGSNMHPAPGVIRPLLKWTSEHISGNS